MFDRYHEHGHDDDPPAFDPYEGYPSGYDTDWSYPPNGSPNDPEAAFKNHKYAQ